MQAIFQQNAIPIVSSIVQLAQRHALTVLLAAVIAGYCGFSYTVSRIAISTDTEDMLSEKLEWRRAYQDYKQTFPYFADTIVVVIDADTPDLASAAADALADALAQQTETFDEVFHPAADAFFRANQFLYLDVGELQSLVDQLSAAQPFIARLAADPSSYEFLTLLEEVLGADIDVAGLNVDTTLYAVAEAVNALLDDDHVPMSWRRLLGGSEFEGDTRVLFTAKAQVDFTSLLPGKSAMVAIRDTARTLGLTPERGVTVRLTGGVALGYDNLQAVVVGAERVGVLALIMVAACLLIGLKSVSLVAATLFTLVVGLILTATFATAAVGTLNMISVAFAVLYVGLGVDFAVHLCLRYRELLAYEPKPTAIRRATEHIGGSIILCATTTALAFFTFIPTAYRGVAELGLISGVGMFIALGLSFTVLPAVLQILPAPAKPATRARRDTPLAALPERVAPWILTAAAVIAVSAIFVALHARFDHNPLHLQDQSSESVRTLADLARGGNDIEHSISLVLPAGSPVTDVSAALEQLPEVDGVVSAHDFVPHQQADKRAIIDDLSLTLGPGLILQAPTPREAGTLPELVQALSVRTGPGSAAPVGVDADSQSALHAALKRLAAQIGALTAAQRTPFFSTLEHKLLGHFAPQIERLEAGLNPSGVSMNTLPESLRKRWIAPDGRFRVEITPAQDVNDNDNLEAFVAAARSVAGDIATGTPIINVEASRAVVAAFIQAFICAVLLVALIIFVSTKRLLDTLVVLAPLLLAGLITTAFAVSLGIAFNFANVIALPLLLGVGVDSAVHILHRYKTMAPDEPLLLQTSTARAVVFSALTTTASFGNLALSPHAGTASMGVMLSIGLIATLLCTLIVLPALLSRFIEAPARAAYVE